MLKIKNPVVDSKLMECSFPLKLSLKSIQIIWGNPYMFLSRICEYFVGNKAKGRILKRVFQENKARQIFRKTNISYPLIRTRTCAYQEVRNVRFSENLACFVFLKHPFWDLPVYLITDDFGSESRRILPFSGNFFETFYHHNHVGTVLFSFLMV